MVWFLAASGCRCDCGPPRSWRANPTEPRPRERPRGPDFVHSIVVANSAPCQLCQIPGADSEHRIAGLDLCVECFRGDLRDAMRGRGFELHQREWRGHGERDEGPDAHNTEVTAVSTHVPGINAVFTKERFGVRLSKFFGKHADELQTGDEVFDDSIFVETSTPLKTQRMLEHEGIQLVISDAVASFGEIRFGAVPYGTKIRVYGGWSEGRGLPPKTGLQRTIAIVLHHLENLSRHGPGEDVRVATLE